jgi:hypothetical protein
MICEECQRPRIGMPCYAVLCVLCAKREGLVERNTGTIVGDRRKRVETFPNLKQRVTDG